MGCNFGHRTYFAYLCINESVRYPLHLLYIMANNEQQKQGQVQVNMTPEVEKGVYSNLTIMGFTPTEFIMDFVFHHPGMPRANVQSRVVMSPVQAKRLMRLLEQNMENYEKANGQIVLPEDVQPKGPISPFKVN